MIERPRRRARSAAARILIAAVVGVAPAAAWAVEGDPSQPGAYCKLPEPGEKPACLAPGEARYSDFFEAVDDPATAEQPNAEAIEADLAAGGADSVLALSSLAYGYWRLALQASEDGEVDPELAAQLEEWNRLLTEVYRASEDDPALREALREAAVDLEARTATAEYEPADDLLGRFEEELGVRGAIKRVLRRLFASEGDAQ